MKVLIVSGPTATGKTDLAIELAKKFGGEVVNFDSLLLYREIIIGTAKPTIEEQELIPHHMIDVRSIAQPMNAADYARQAYPVVEGLLKKKQLVYLTGGSGFYLQALIKGMYDSPTTPPDISQESDVLYQNEGIAPFLKILEDYDKKSFLRYHQNDHYRIRRAVEHWWTTGSPISHEREKKDCSNFALEKPSVHDWEILHLYMDIPRVNHLDIIESRTDRMLKMGLIEETRFLLSQGFTGDEKPLQSIGYKESINYIRGVYKSLAECRERIIISTRQLAKAQRTWFKKDSFKEPYNPLEQRDDLFNRVEQFIQK